MSLDTQLASGHVPVLYLAQLEFADGTLRLTSWSHNLPFFGYDWLGLGALCGVSPIKASDRVEYPAVDLSLQIGNDAMLAAVLEAPTSYRGRPATLWQAWLNDELQPEYEPELFWAGRMSQVRVKTADGDRDGGTAVMRCEQYGRDGRAAASLRMNDAQHQARWPGDTFLSRVEGLNGKPVPWLSVKFQRV